MKVSKEIQNKMHRLAQLSNKTAQLSADIDEYFTSKGFDIETLRCGNGKSLEELELGNDITEEFCEFIENGFQDVLW